MVETHLFQGVFGSFWRHVQGLEVRSNRTLVSQCGNLPKKGWRCEKKKPSWCHHSSKLWGDSLWSLEDAETGMEQDIFRFPACWIHVARILGLFSRLALVQLVAWKKLGPESQQFLPFFRGRLCYFCVSKCIVSHSWYSIYNDTVSIFSWLNGTYGLSTMYIKLLLFFLSFFLSFSLSLSLPKTVLVYTHIRSIFAHCSLVSYLGLLKTHFRHCSNWYWPVAMIATHFSVCLAEWSLCSALEDFAGNKMFFLWGLWSNGQGFSATCSRNMILVTMFFALSASCLGNGWHVYEGPVPHWPQATSARNM